MDTADVSTLVRKEYKQMKIVHAGYSDSGGGAAQAAYRIHKGLRNLGVDSKMLVSKKLTEDPDVMDSGSPMGRLWSQITPYLDLLPFALMRNERSSFMSLAWAGTRQLSAFSQLNPDLIHLHWICAGFLRLEDIAKLQKPIVWRLADMWPFAGAEHYVGECQRYKQGYFRHNRTSNEKGFDFNQWVWKRKRKAWSKIQNLTIVSPSRWLADCARESVLFGECRIEVIPTGQDVSIFRPIPKDTARNILGLPQDKKLIMSGTLGFSHDPRKGSHFFKDALSYLFKNRGKDYEIFFIGDSVSVNSSDLKLKAHYLGRLNDGVSLSLAYSAADVFVAPSVQENLANTVIESMACGTPCVAFQIGGMPDIIKHEHNGYLARPFDPEDLAKGIEWVLESGDYYHQLKEEARSIVQREFSQEIQARRYLELYEDILGTKNR